MKSTVNTNLANKFPKLVKSKIDDSIYLANKDKKGVIFVMCLHPKERIGCNWISTLKESDYEDLPEGFSITLTN